LAEVSVVIVNWNGKKLLSDCLNGLRAQTFQPFSVIFVDNGSKDGSIDFVNRHYPEVDTIPLSENIGFSAANNLAIKTVKTEYVALINNDAVAHPQWLTHLLEGLKSHSEAGFAASKMLFYDKPETIDRVGDAYTRAGAGLLRGRSLSASYFNKEELIFGACAGAALYRTRMLEEIGLFDEDFFLLYEDVDLSFRAQLRGYKCLYVPKAIVYHKGSASIVHDSSISVYYSHRNLEWVYIQNMPASLLIRTFWRHAIYNLAAFAYFSTNGHAKDFLKAKWDALMGLNKSMKKRRNAQRNRTVENHILWRLIDKERFFDRLKRRLNKI
jgi:GT2 family glycosyltransferase